MGTKQSLTVRFHYRVKSALCATGNATALGHVKFRAEHATENHVYTLFEFLLLTAIGCHPVFFARYLHKYIYPTFLMLSATLNAFLAPLSPHKRLCSTSIGMNWKRLLHVNGNAP